MHADTPFSILPFTHSLTLSLTHTHSSLLSLTLSLAHSLTHSLFLTHTLSLPFHALTHKQT